MLQIFWSQTCSHDFLIRKGHSLSVGAVLCVPPLLETCHLSCLPCNPCLILFQRGLWFDSTRFWTVLPTRKLKFVVFPILHYALPVGNCVVLFALLLTRIVLEDVCRYVDLRNQRVEKCVLQPSCITGFAILFLWFWSFFDLHICIRLFLHWNKEIPETG